MDNTSIKPHKNKSFFLFCNAYFVLGLSSILVLLVSFALEYMWKIEPCFLCKLQRVPYFFVLLICLFKFFQSVKQLTAYLILGCLLLSVILAIYHSLMQLGIVSDSCIVPQAIMTLNDFEMMLANKVKPCSVISVEIFGLPLSMYNAYFSVSWLIFWLFRISLFSGSDWLKMHDHQISSATLSK